MATPKKAKHPRRARAARKEAVPDVQRATSVSSGAAPLRVVPAAAAADPEVAERAARRRFTAEYKLQVLRHAEACASSGEVGALLRREGLYSSHLTTWRRQRERKRPVNPAPR